MVATKKKRQIVKGSDAWSKQTSCVITAAQGADKYETDDTNRPLTPEEIAEARQKIREKFEALARRLGFVME